MVLPDPLEALKGHQDCLERQGPRVQLTMLPEPQGYDLKKNSRLPNSLLSTVRTKRTEPGLEKATLASYTGKERAPSKTWGEYQPSTSPASLPYGGMA